MEEPKVLNKCNLCGRIGEELTLLSANLKKTGWTKVCSTCWRELYARNRMISGSAGSSKNSSSACKSCPSRCY